MSPIIFGPIQSRRFGKSLGVDLSPSKKQCNFDCLYCELEPVKTVAGQEEVIGVERIIEAIKEGLRTHRDIDVLTITANGEPTLYPHLGQLIEAINTIKGETKTLILSNGSTIGKDWVQEALCQFDEVKLSLDCATEPCLKRLDRAHLGISAAEIKEGMLRFAARYRGVLVIEILLVATLNDKPEEIAALNSYLLKLRPHRIDLGTIDRPPAFDVKPVEYAQMVAISQQFDPSLPLYIASRTKGTISPSAYSDAEILDTLAKRPLTQEDIEALFDYPSQVRFERLKEEGLVVPVASSGVIFYKKG